MTKEMFDRTKTPSTPIADELEKRVAQATLKFADVMGDVVQISVEETLSALCNALDVARGESVSPEVFLSELVRGMARLRDEGPAITDRVMARLVNDSPYSNRQKGEKRE